jgi:hypothetical protein
MTLAGEGEFSIRNTFIIASVPTVQVKPQMVSQSNSSITINWSLTNDGGSVVTGYQLY